MISLLLVATPLLMAAAQDKLPPPLDPQSWKLNRDQTWHDFLPNPVIDWSDDLNPASLDNKFAFGGNSPNTPIVGGLILVEYLDRKFISRGEVGSDPLGYYLFNNDGSGMQTSKTHNPMYNVPQLIAEEKGIALEDVTDAMFAHWWADYLNKPQAVNNFSGIDEFWREVSYGKWAVDLRPYGPYTIPYFEFETMSYDIGSNFQTYRDVPPSFRTGSSGTGSGASFDTQAQSLAVAQGVPFGTFDFFFLFHAGYAESGVWQEFGQSQFATRKDIPYELGPGPRMKKVEQFFTQNPEWLATYVGRYSGTPSASFWAGELSKYNTLVAAGAANTYQFHLQQADWDWVAGYNDQTQRNTRYVNFTSWEAAVGEWSHAGSYSYQGRSIRRSTQGENNGMATFAHEFGHISGIGDNYGTPWVDNYSPATEPWELMSRGSFAGPFGDHARWTVPGIEAETIPVHFMQRSKEYNQLYDNNDVLTLNVQQLAEQTPLIAEVVARNIPLNNNGFYPWLEEYGLKSPNYYKAIKLNFGSGAWADQVTRKTTGFTWNRNAATNMTVEVVQRTGYDSFTPDDGVIIARNGGSPFTHVIDSHLYDIAMIDYELNGDYTPYPMAHAAQLFDAAFHAGKSFVDSGYYASEYNPADPNYSQERPIYYDSSYNRVWVKDMIKPGSIFQWEKRNGRDIVSGDTVNEFLDVANKLHFYVLEKHLTPAKNGDFLSYQIGVLRTDGVAVGGELEVALDGVESESPGKVAVANFSITNTGEATDIVRVGVEGYLEGVLLNDLYAIEAGQTITVPVYVELPYGIRSQNLQGQEITLSAGSETNSAKTGSAGVLIEDLLAYNYEVYLLPQETGYAVGETVLVDVMLKGDANYTMFSADIAFDTNLLQYETYTYLTGWVASVTSGAGKVSIRNMPSSNMALGSPANLKIATMQFKVLGNFSEKITETALSLPNVLVTPPGTMKDFGAAPTKELPLTLYDSDFTKSFYINMELYPGWIGLDADGLPTTQPIFQYADAITEIVWVEVPCDTDRDGLRDRVSVWVMRPKTADGFRCPVMLEHSPYHHSTVGWSAVSGAAFNGEYDYMRAPFRYRHNWPIHRDPENPAFADTTHLTYDDIAYKGIESFSWPWVETPFETGSWYTGTNYGNVPAATVSAQDALGNTIYDTPDSYSWSPSNAYRYYLPRGYALVYGQLLGARDGDGVTNTLHVEEVLSAMAVINWLSGDAKAYTSRRGNVEAKAFWSNGHVGMTGTSYPADTAFATVVSGVEGLKAVMPQCNGLNWYDYYRYAGTVNSPGGYGGEDLNLHASYNFSRWRADGISNGQIPPANGQWFGKAIQDVFFETQNHMMQMQDSITGNYNTEWELRNFGRHADRINEDVGLLMTTGFMDWNSQPKLSMANWTVLLDKCPATFKEFASISSHAGQSSAVIYGKSIVEWWHYWMDHFCLGLDNGVVEALPDLTVINTKTGAVEGYNINKEAQPEDDDYLVPGGIIPGAKNHKLYLVPAKDGKAGRLSYEVPALAVDHFNDMDVLDMLQADYPGAPTLTSSQKTINLSSDGNYRVTTGSGTTSQAQFCEGRAVGVNRTYNFGISGTAAADIQAINNQIFAAVDKPIEGRLMYLSEPLTEDVRLSGTGVVYLSAAPDRAVGNISAAVVEIGRVRNMESSRSNAWGMSVGTGNNLLQQAYALPLGGGQGSMNVGTFRNPSEVGAFMNYKYVTVGYADIMNPNYSGKVWFEVPEQNYIPDFYFQTTKIVPGKYYPYTIELDPYDYIFRAGSQIGIMIFGTDPDYSLLYDKDGIAQFDIAIGPDSYAILPLTKALNLNTAPTLLNYETVEVSEAVETMEAIEVAPEVAIEQIVIIE